MTILRVILMINMLKKSSTWFNWSEFHLSEMTCYKIHTLVLEDEWPKNNDFSFLFGEAGADLGILKSNGIEQISSGRPVSDQIFSLIFLTLFGSGDWSI